MIDKEQFNKFLDQGHDYIPLQKKLDLKKENPLSLFKKVSHLKNNFLLESVEGGNKWSQYSIIGFDCQDFIKISDGKIIVSENGLIDERSAANPLDELHSIINNISSPIIDDLPRFFGGYVGFFAYESSKYAEKKIAELATKPSKFNEHMPEIHLVKAEKLIIFDNLTRSTQIIFNVDTKKFNFEEAVEQIDKIENLINANPITFPSLNEEPSNAIEFSANISKNEYERNVARIKQYIKEGDVMQVVYAQDFYCRFVKDSFDLYRAIRSLNPSPYMYYLQINDLDIVGASPEILVRLMDNEITYRPIAGTRKRGKNVAEDKLLAADLLSDPKELAEHLMLIDLGRNDIGRVSDIGSVEVNEKMIIENYSHVMHIVSNIKSTLSSKSNFIELIKSTLPAGTLSGAPKIRAMEIINELEPSSRGIYGGAIGYISWSGNIDTAIAIRTAIIKDKVMHVGAGAGIVADSIPENEWHECKHKSKVFVDAIKMIP